MKKSIIAAALAGTMLLSGCSGVSEESYNSVVAENTRLKAELSSTPTSEAEINSNEDSSSLASKPLTSIPTDKDNDSGNSDFEPFISPLTGMPWIYDNEAAFVTSGNLLEEKTDEEIIDLCYADAFYFATDKEYSEEYFFYLYWLDADKQEILSACTITHLFGDTKISLSWYNDWEEFGNTEKAKKWEEVIENFDFNSTDGNFELDGYKVEITGDYEFSTVENQFSEWNGKPVIKIAANIENISSEYNFCMLFCSITDPNGNEIHQLDAFFDDGILGKEMKKGKYQNRYFTIPYMGDGEYKLEFSDIVSQKYVYKIDVKKP